MRAQIRSLIKMDSDQTNFIVIHPSEEVALSINFAEADASNIYEKKRPYGGADLLRELLYFLQTVSEHLSARNQDFNEQIRIVKASRWFDLIDELIKITCSGRLDDPLLTLRIEENDESIVPNQNKTYSTSQQRISWLNLLHNISGLIAELNANGLEDLNDEEKLIYEELSSRGFLIEEVKESLTKRSN